MRLYGVPKQIGPRQGVASKIRVVGVQAALAKLATVDKVARLELGQILAGGAIVMERTAKEKVHKISHNLETGIKMAHPAPYTYFVTASSMEGSDPTGEGKNTKEYAGYEEFGWSGLIGGHPYMRPAFEYVKPIILADLRWFAKKIERL